MKVVKAEAWIVKVPLLAEWTSSPEYGEHGNKEKMRLIIALQCEDGIIGWGEGLPSLGTEEIKSALSRLINQSLGDIRLSFLDLLWEPGKHYWQRPSPPSPFASPVGNLRHRLRHPLQTTVEMALIDIITRRAGVPFSSYFGGEWRDRVSSDYWMGRTTPEHAARCAQRGYALGFRGIKLKTTLEDPNIERLEAIQAATFSGFHVTVDPNGRFYRLDDAKSTIRAMDAVGNMSILEDPFPRTALAETKALRNHLQSRVVVHIDPPESLAQVITAECCGGLNIDSHTQGLLQWRLQADTADQFSLPVWHGSGLDLGIYTAAQLHLAASAPNCQLPGDQAGPWLRESTLVKETFVVQNGCIFVPRGHGLGITPNRDEIDRYTTTAFTLELV